MQAAAPLVLQRPPAAECSPPGLGLTELGTRGLRIGTARQEITTVLLNGETRQDGDLEQQIWPVPDTIAHLSTLFELQPGDLIMTGTPAGVGPLVPGDKVTGGIDGIAKISLNVV